MQTKSKLVGNILSLDSDPNTNSFVRVRGAPSRTAEGKKRGGHTWWMPGAGKGLGEYVINGAAARPAVVAREGRARAKGGEGSTEGKGEEI